MMQLRASLAKDAGSAAVVHSILGVAAALFASCLSSTAGAQLYLNEIFFDPGSSGADLVDARDEYIELRGPAGMSLDNHYLIFIESEDDSNDTGPAGLIDNIFDLNGRSLGSNGFLVIRPGGNKTGDATDSGPSQYTLVPGATDLENTGPGAGYGSGATSTIGASDVGNEGTIENGAFTAMLIHVDSVAGAAPVLDFDLDTDNNGLDHPDGQPGWTILDSVSAFEPFEAIFGQAYGQVAFGKEAIGELAFFNDEIVQANPGLEPGAEYLGVGWEVEYLARWGNSTGSGLADWHASNLTVNTGSGAQSNGPLDQRQSYTGSHGDLASGSINSPPSQPTPAEGRLESSQGVPYGTPLLTNIGGPNFILGDFNGDGVVNTADYTVFRDTEGATATELAAQPADVDRSFVVDQGDYDIWAGAFGAPNATPVGSSNSVPEPVSAALVAAGALGGLAVGRRR